jgi:signal recognition particle receptor subunit beta
MFINWALQEINLKIVFYGPGMSGKTTNLEFIHSKLDPSLAGELVSLKTKEDRTIFFDFMQIEVGRIKGKKPKFNLYTVPGQVYYADSQPHRMEANIETLLDLENNLKQDGQSLEEFPWVIQYNKRDLPGVESVETLQKKLNFFNVPHFEAIAVRGEGVFNTLKAIINNVVQHVQNQL